MASEGVFGDGLAGDLRSRVAGFVATLPSASEVGRRARGLLARVGDRAERFRAALVAILKPLLRSPRFERAVTALILVNAVTLGLETSATVTSVIGPLLSVIDTAILIFFVVEIAARMLVYGTKFWRDPWSVFDFLVVGVTLLPATDNISVLRALRTIRALRLISIVPSMRRVVNALIGAIPGMTSIVVLLGLIFYVAAVMTTNMFGEEFPKLFGSIGASAFSLFQVMSLDGWTGDVARPVMEKYPFAWVFFIPFILITSFTVLNLFIGIIVDAMQQQHIEQRGKSDLVIASKFGRLRTKIKADLGQLQSQEPLQAPSAAAAAIEPAPEAAAPSITGISFTAPVSGDPAPDKSAASGAELATILTELRQLRDEVRALRAKR